jgi:DNA-binding protein H-NS
MLKTIGSVSQRVRVEGLRISNIGTKYGEYSQAMAIKLGSGSGSGSGTKRLEPRSSNGPVQASQSHGTWTGRLDGMTH